MAQTTEASEYLAQKTNHLTDSELAGKLGTMSLQDTRISIASRPSKKSLDQRTSYFPDNNIAIEAGHFSQPDPGRNYSHTNSFTRTNNHSLSNTATNRSFSGPPSRSSELKGNENLSKSNSNPPSWERQTLNHSTPNSRNSNRMDSSDEAKPPGASVQRHRSLRDSIASTRSYDNIQQAHDQVRRERRPSTAPQAPRDLEAEAYYAESRLSTNRALADAQHNDPHSYSNLPRQKSFVNQSTQNGDSQYAPNHTERSGAYDQPPNRTYEDPATRSSTSSGHRQPNPPSPPDSIPLPQIPTKEALETYRQNAKKSHDPEVQLDFAKYLIETAALVLANHGDQVDPQTARKLHNTLITEALKWIKRLSSQGIGLGKGAYPDAQFFLANCYNNGSLGLPVDHDKAFNLYVQASKQNHPAATYRTGVCYEFGAGTKRDHHRALQFFRKAAALGDTAAMFKVGMVLLKGGLGQQSNPREGITWLKRAAASADEENPHALHELASCYEKGGIPSIIADASYARELYTQAAQLGYAHSQFKMGVCYEQGQLTCPVDPRRSIAWFTRGAEQGDPECELALSGWYLTGSEGVLKQSDTEAYLWARKAADKGLAKAEYAVGYYSEVGIGVKQDLDEARRWFMRAAAQGNKRAMERLTELKKLGAARRGGPKSKEDAGCIIS